jgi:hypothetical protein
MEARMFCAYRNAYRVRSSKLESALPITPPTPFFLAMTPALTL